MKCIYIIPLFIVSLTISCFSNRDIIRKSNIKFEDKNNGIDNIINIDGYYMTHDDGLFFFYKDGTWVSFGVHGLDTIKKIKNLSKAITFYNGKKQMYWGFEWGVYGIQHDTIFVNSYYRHSPFNLLNLKNIAYKIIDRNTIQLLYSRLDGMNDYRKPNTLLHFVHADSIPAPYTWLKEYKWMWHNEVDWEKYIQHIKEVKRQTKLQNREKK